MNSSSAFDIFLTPSFYFLVNHISLPMSGLIWLPCACIVFELSVSLWSAWERNGGTGWWWVYVQYVCIIIVRTMKRYLFHCFVKSKNSGILETNGNCVQSTVSFLHPKELTLTTCCPSFSISSLSPSLSHHTSVHPLNFNLILFSSLSISLHPIWLWALTTDWISPASVHSAHMVQQLSLCATHKSVFQLTSVSAWCQSITTHSHLAPCHL